MLGQSSENDSTPREIDMKRIEHRYPDRPESVGPWKDEPDKVQWQDEATGLPCLIVRHPSMGFLCGYVGVPEGHRYFGGSHKDLDLRVHGGLTFSGRFQHSGDEGRGVCHAPEPGEPDNVWWFGFDCGHAWDKAPYKDQMFPQFVIREEIYRDVDYVAEECRALALQLKVV